jgi:tRNA G18 (ribose-2'-O)-methylase SpoU
VTVSGLDDERLADFVDLADPAARRRRERDEIFVAEGLIAVQRLIESPHRIRTILVTPKHRSRVEALLGVADTDIVVADEDAVAATVGFNFHRGVVASAQRLPYRASPRSSPGSAALPCWKDSTTPRTSA